MKKFDFFRQFRDAVLIINKKNDVVYRNHTFKRWFKDFSNLKKFSHNSNFDICPLNSENIEIYSPIYHAAVSKEDFFARISYQSELNRIYYYDLQAVKKGNYTIIFFTDVSAQNKLQNVNRENEKLQEKYEKLLEENKDLQKIKQKALEKKLLTKEELSAISDDELTNLVFYPGFSTENFVTELSGRGLGLDIVNNKINQLQGRIDIFSVREADFLCLANDIEGIYQRLFNM